MSKKNIIILGTGFAAFSCIKKLDPALYNIYVISKRNHFLFTPLLPSTTVGTIEFRSIIEPIRNLKRINFYKSTCKSIDPETKTITCEEIDTKKDYELKYDILVIAVGEETNTFNIEGVKENALFLKEISDARKIRTKVIECFENASLPGLSIEDKKNNLRFVVCGGGPTGVEFAAELHDFIEEDLKKKYKNIADLTELILIEAGTKLLNTFDKKLSAYTMKIFKRQKIIVKTNSTIIKVTNKSLYLNDNTNFPYGLLVWSTGNSASELISQSKFPKTSKKKIIVDKYFKIKDFENLYAIGDCCECEDTIYPVIAQVAQQEGKFLGKLLNNVSRGNDSKPFNFHNFGMLAYIGSGKALADIPQYKGSGFTTFLFWRSVYFTKLVSLKNKILVLFDWLKKIIFGRDVSNF
jgi:NADH:ubiquinone reductase (non-electrogenic)